MIIFSLKYWPTLTILYIFIYNNIIIIQHLNKKIQKDSLDRTNFEKETESLENETESVQCETGVPT